MSTIHSSQSFPIRLSLLSALRNLQIIPAQTTLMRKGENKLTLFNIIGQHGWNNG